MAEWIDASFTPTDSDGPKPESAIRDRMLAIMTAAGPGGVHWTEFRRKIDEWRGDPDAKKVYQALY